MQTRFPAGLDAEAARAIDPDIDRRRMEAANAAWGGATPGASQPPPSAPEPAATGNRQVPGLENLSLDELEAELAKRRAAKNA